ncbi:MAG: VWA domain-containing protein [Gammaproteobacteria bacterium]|nr:VWA domain-containing protein [Gammaproteobacteria bacterium]MCP5135326.1 VWA domain-containing protein [Gammaproteobacteria bacterium]
MHPNPTLVVTLAALLTASLLSACTRTGVDSTSPQPVVLPSQPQAIPRQHAQQAMRDMGKMQSTRMIAPMALAEADYRMANEPTDREIYADIDENPIHRVAESPVSTFSIDVDTGAYSNVRRFLNAGRLPPTDAVRVEELINYFNYADAGPENADTPFAVHTEVGPTPWNAQTRLLRIGIKAWAPEADTRPAANLVFLVDVSGSMNADDKLPLLKRSLRLLSDQLTARDRVSLVVYAGASGVVLESTPGDKKAQIHAALNNLEAGGSTNGASGIHLAYEQARDGFIEDGINRVLIATDGDFNVGNIDHDRLIDLIEQQRHDGIALTTLGFGSGNYNDALMEQLADHGNGNHAYIDTLQEARKVLVDELGSTLQTVASDVKIQIEFNPTQVAEYRLIGYQNRILAREDFNNDKVDAGEIGAGHSLTALYEITPLGNQTQIEPLRYAGKAATKVGKSPELAYLKLRYKPVGSKQSTLITHPIAADAVQPTLARTSDDYRFAAAVAAFGEQLRGGKYLGDMSYPAIHDLASAARGEDPAGYRGSFLELIRLAAALDGHPIKLSNR